MVIPPCLSQSNPILFAHRTPTHKHNRSILGESGAPHRPRVAGDSGGGPTRATKMQNGRQTAARTSANRMNMSSQNPEKRQLVCTCTRQDDETAPSTCDLGRISPKIGRFADSNDRLLLQPQGNQTNELPNASWCHKLSKSYLEIRSRL